MKEGIKPDICLKPVVNDKSDPDVERRSMVDIGVHRCGNRVDGSYKNIQL